MLIIGNFQSLLFKSMKEFPITFAYKGNQYSGILSPVAGAGVQLYHLQIGKYYRGQLLFVRDKWTFLSQTKEFEELGELFGKHVSTVT
jgi:hypothetical protein